MQQRADYSRKLKAGTYHAMLKQLGLTERDLAALGRRAEIEVN
jgi:hypothetical protein